MSDFEIPESAAQWRDTVTGAKLSKSTINDLPAALFGSASKASHKQFLMLRAIHEHASVQTFRKNARHFGFEAGIFAEATLLLKDSLEWQNYIEAVAHKRQTTQLQEKAPGWPGVFVIPLLLQEQTTTVAGVPDAEAIMAMPDQARSLRTATEPEKKEYRLSDAEDEMVVNAGAASFLQAISTIMPSTLEWSMAIAHFHPTFKNGNFHAHTDGALRLRRYPDEICALLEVKARNRIYQTTQIVIQEACEMSGWLWKAASKVACFKGHYLLVSQDR